MIFTSITEDLVYDAADTLEGLTVGGRDWFGELTGKKRPETGERSMAILRCKILLQIQVVGTTIHTIRRMSTEFIGMNRPDEEQAQLR